ncbi:hypothetical protein BDV06DRAFT_186842, partial [Aspergillus oleicola]
TVVPRVLLRDEQDDEGWYIRTLTTYLYLLSASRALSSVYSNIVRSPELLLHFLLCLLLLDIRIPKVLFDA